MSMFKESLKTIALSLIILSLISIAYAWTEPTQIPPNGNTSAPVNVSSTSQAKSGALQVNGFRNLGTTILDGNVGVGTTSPLSKLSAQGTDVGISVINAANDQNYYFGIKESDKKLYIGRGKDPSQGVAPAIVVTQTDNVGIGTTSPSQKLDVAGYVKGQTGLCIGADCKTSWPSGGGILGSGTANYISKWTDSSTVGNSIVLDNGTAIGIGMIVDPRTGIATTPSSGLKLDVEGKVGATEYCDQDGLNCKSILNMGASNICTWGSKTYTTGAECDSRSSCTPPTGSYLTNTFRCKSDGTWLYLGNPYPRSICGC